MADTALPPPDKTPDDQPHPQTPNDRSHPLHATARIVNRLGLHARAAARFVTLAEQFAAEIEIARAGQSVNACSIMGLMMLGAACGEDVALTATGTDAHEALHALVAMIDDGFGERD